MKNNSQLFIVCGASSGFGGAVTTRLINEGHRVVAIARDKKRFNPTWQFFTPKIKKSANFKLF